MAKTKKKENETETETKKYTPKQVFIIKLILFLLFSCIAPITYLTIRYNLFTTTSKLNIGIWGVIVFGILIAVIGVFCKYYVEGLKTKYTYLKQIIQGFTKVVLPLVLALVCLVYLKDNVGCLIESLAIILPCEIIAIFINPLPKWQFENNVEGLVDIGSKIFSKKDKDSKEK